MASVVVSENGQGRFGQSIVTGTHQLTADEPLAAGGNDAGPAPFDLVLAGLGACTAMTLRLYAERKEIRLTYIGVALTHDTVEVDGQRRDRIERTITLEGELTPAERQRLLDIANHCPVHRAITQPMLVDTRLSP